MRVWAGFLCVLLPLAGVAFGTEKVAPDLKSLVLEESEEDADPPALVWRTESSPRMISVHGNFTSSQVNVGANGANIVGDAANEPSITMNPTNSAQMSIGWRQFNTAQSNFRQGGFAYTTNRGVSWTFPGSLTSGFRSDPVLLSDTNGSFFYLSLVPNFFDDIWRSGSGGQSWFRLGPATGGDKQWFTIDNGKSTGHGYQYQSWSSGGNNYDGRLFTRSIDGGFTWMDPINIPNSPSWGTLDVASNGNLFIGGVSLETGVFWCLRSSDAKTAAVIPSFDQTTEVDLGGSVFFGGDINPEGLAGQVFLAVDRAGARMTNNVYMLASLNPFNFATGTDVMFARSTDGGKTFSHPRRLNDDAVNGIQWHWLGTLAVAPNGRIDVVWLDTRNAANHFDSQLFYTYSTDRGESWSPNVAVSDAFNPFLGYPNQEKMGDYITIVSDNDGGNVAYCATFNLEEDIYYVRVSPAAALASLPLFSIQSLTHDANGIALTFPSTVGKSYRCDYSDFPTGPWATLQTEISGTGAAIAIDDPEAATRTKRFYRVVVLP